MAKLLFSLRGVPEDEAEEIRELLSANAIDYYETPPGNWGISMPALWLQNETQFEQAQILLNTYQNNRSTAQRALYEQLKKEGKAPTLFKSIAIRPGRFILTIGYIILILYISIKLLYELGF